MDQFLNSISIPLLKMVRVITQETFDAAVKENKEDLDMSPEEAVKEAVEQFEAQVGGERVTTSFESHAGLGR